MIGLILASHSASRRAMLTAAGVPFTALASGVDEESAKAALRGEQVAPRDLADALAELKAVKLSARMPGALVLGGDSLVALADGRVLDKPSSRDEAADHLRALSGGTHLLISAAVIAEGGRPVWRVVDQARLVVRSLSEAFIGGYLDAEWPAIVGCVGCFRIEGPGVQLFARIDGDHFTTLGMPLFPVLEYMRVRGDPPGVIDLPYAEVIGDPIAHSKSPLIHRFWLGALGIEAEYRATHVAPEQLAGFFANRRADPVWRGCSVTIPHKVAALDHVEDLGGLRETIGAINLVLRDGDAVIGTNTDAAGFYAPLAGVKLAGQHVVVIGAGGAARAVLFALAKMAVARVSIFNRSQVKAMALLSRHGLTGGVFPLDAPLPPAALVVNTSVLGMAGQPPLDLDLSPLPADALVYDLVYAPLETPLLAQAHARGLETIDGLDMLIGQAAVAFELLFGQPPPRERDEELRAALTA